MVKTADELRNVYDQAAKLVKIGGKYAHYKHPELAKYEVELGGKKMKRFKLI